jgi:hypothetical protein
MTPSSQDDDHHWAPEALEQKILEILHKAGIRQEIIYAFQKTGRMVTEDNYKKLSPAELKAWEDAVDEWREHHGHETQ